MIPKTLIKKISDKSESVDCLFEQADSEFFLCIKLDYLEKILEEWFKKEEEGEVY